MRKAFCILLALLPALTFAQRYLQPVFTTVAKTSNVTYGWNWSILQTAEDQTGTQISNTRFYTDSLKMDVYRPAGDTSTKRPVVLLCHGGSFLPYTLTQPSYIAQAGTKTDSSLVEICNRFAKRGYVAVSFEYRLGWNPSSTNQEIRTKTFVLAVYRAMQDAKACIRYMKANASTYGIDPDKIVLGGSHSGAWAALLANTLNKPAEINLPRFTDQLGAPYIDTTLFGNFDGLGGTVNNNNTSGISSAFNLTLSLGGDVLDTSWVNAGENPIVAFHGLSDLLAPYNTGVLLTGAGTIPIISVSGPGDFMPASDLFGNQDILNGCFTQGPASTDGNVYEGNYPFRNAGFEPWGWYDTTHAAHLAIGFPASRAKANAYIDTIFNYFLPRAYRVLVDQGYHQGSSAPATAGFTSSISGPTVTFTNSSANANGYYWEFGDGTFSTVSNPQHTYTLGGTYQVCLSALSCAAPSVVCNSVTVTGSCVVPAASFSYTSAATTVQFNDGSQNNPTSWSWAFGDGITSTSQNPIHSYSTAGAYTVCLVVTNACGTHTNCQTVTVGNCAAPVASFTHTITGTSAQFNDISQNNATSWSWAFGDGGSSISQHPVHVYSTSGTYTVCLTAASACGTDTACITVTVLCVAPIASFSFSAAGATAQFSDGSQFNPTSWSWTFGDGSTSSQQNPLHTYTTTGTYTVCLSASNTCGTNNTCQTVAITCALSANITPSSGTICSGDTLTLTAPSGSGYTYQWYRNGSVIPNASSIEYRAFQQGAYTVVISNGSCSATSAAVNLNIGSAPVISITSVGSTTFCAGGSVILQATTGLASFSWNTGASSSSIVAIASGAYSVTGTGTNGCTASADFFLNASSLQPPDICIVGVDSATNKNIIIWEKSITSAIDSYVIYKETNQADVYTRIASLPYNTFSTFIDNASDPQQRAFRYKLGIIDSCNSQTLPGTLHKTIHLTINQGVGNSWNLIWSHYEGFTFPSYNIYRGTSTTTLSLLTTIPSNLNSYTDIMPPAGQNVFYQIEVVNPNTCNPTAKMTNYSSSKSNIVNTGSVGFWNNLENYQLNIYPNPFSETTIIELPAAATENYQLRLIDLLSTKVRRENNIKGKHYLLNREGLAPGIYFIELVGEKKYLGKVVVH